jgi:hypothetical protein
MTSCNARSSRSSVIGYKYAGAGYILKVCDITVVQMGLETPDELSINCTNLGSTSDIFSKVHTWIPNYGHDLLTDP